VEIRCPECNKGPLERKTIPQTFTYKGHSLTVDQPAEWCRWCGEGILDGDDIGATEKARNDFRVSIDALVPER
jgi:HTH-type transcriptional regulator/antitoxin MqsA